MLRFLYVTATRFNDSENQKAGSKPSEAVTWAMIR